MSAGTRALLLLPRSLVSLPTSPIHRPSRRFLYDNSLTGSMPSQLGLLTALTKLCAATLPHSHYGRGRTRGQGGAEGGRCVCGRAHVALVALPIGLFPYESALRRPSRRRLHNNDLSGSVPSQLGLLTALTYL